MTAREPAKCFEPRRAAPLVQIFATMCNSGQNWQLGAHMNLERTVLEHGSSEIADAKLADRKSRVEGLKIRDLGATEQERFVGEWQTVHARFVDHPKSAVSEANQLVCVLLKARGYPKASFEQRAADISVTCPRVIEDYRLSNAITVRPGRADASTEELRTAMIQYRIIFEELTEQGEPQVKPGRRRYASLHSDRVLTHKGNCRLPRIVVRQLIEKNNVKQRLMDLDATVVANEAQLAKPIHEEADSGTCGPDHICQRLLRNWRNKSFRLTGFTKFCHQEENPGQTLLAGIEKLVD
jgi:hypothetical protein